MANFKNDLILYQYNSSEWPLFSWENKKLFQNVNRVETSDLLNFVCFLKVFLINVCVY